MKKCLISEVAKTVISIDCAAALCNSEFHTDDALKLSALKKKEYSKQKELIETLLGLSKKLSLDEICAKLEISDSIKADAAHLLNEYKKHKFLSDEINNAQYLTMAIYQSCQIKNYKTNNIKSKLIQMSRLGIKVWKNLEIEWASWIEENPSVLKPVKRANVETDAQEKGKTD